MSVTSSMVIVGGGLAGAKTAEALRGYGYEGDIVLVGAEPHRPYERPPLSKQYLQGTALVEKVFVHPAGWYDENAVDLRLGVQAAAVDRQAHAVVLEGGERLSYEKLVLATGSSPRRLTVPGSDLDNVLYLRTIEDSDRIKATLHPGVRVVIIGGGWIGLETAAAGRAVDAAVTVVERDSLPLLGVLGDEVAQVFADLHRGHGVDLRTSAGVAELVPSGADPSRVGSVRLAGGDEIPADAVVVGVGITPNTQLAEASGLTVRNGVVVDETLRTTTDADIYAVGDVANAYHPFLERHVRVEHWACALHQPDIAAQGMLGTGASFDRLPYFFTDQYDLGMEYLGFVAADGYDSVVVRGDVGAREFMAFWLRHGRVLAGMNVNVWDVVDSVDALIRSRAKVDPSRLADPAVPLESL